MLDAYLNQLNKAPNTKLAVRRDVGAFLREHDPLCVTSKEVRRFFAKETARGLGAKALHERYRHLKEFFSWLVAVGLRQDNPMEDVPEPTARGDLNVILGIRNRAIAELLERGESATMLAGLALEDIDRYKDSQALVQYLHIRHHLQPKTDRVFVTRHGMPMTASAIYWAGGRVAPARVPYGRDGDRHSPAR